MLYILGDIKMSKPRFLPSRTYEHMQSQKQKGKINICDKQSKNAKSTEMMHCVV